jgi:hypothetical protein
MSTECADAYVLLAEAAQDPQEMRSLYEQGVQAGERVLGPEIFAEEVGHFWGIVETRPYMRARLVWPKCCGPQVSGKPPSAISRNSCA